MARRSFSTRRDDRVSARFNKLLAAGAESAGEAIFYAFDLLYFDGHDLERRLLLSGLVAADAGAISLSEKIDGDGDVLLAAACNHGLEGIIGKRLDAPYHSDRRGDWVKIKCLQSDSFFIGYEPSAAALGGIGRLMLAARKGNDLVYVGGVGTGFKLRERIKLRKDLTCVCQAQRRRMGAADTYRPDRISRLERRPLPTRDYAT